MARSITADADTPYDKAKAIESWLKTNIAYNLAIDPPPFGADGVDHFLFESREGYSEYFGSAMTVLSRSIGIPARMTTGYTTGNLIDGSNLYLVSDRHSHGWAEVYFPGYGWIPFEPTPGRAIPVVVPPEERAAMAALSAGSDGSGDLPCEIEEDCEEADISLNADDIPLPEDRTTVLWNTVLAVLPWAIGGRRRPGRLGGVRLGRLAVFAGNSEGRSSNLPAVATAGAVRGVGAGAAPDAAPVGRDSLASPARATVGSAAHRGRLRAQRLCRAGGR